MNQTKQTVFVNGLIHNENQEVLIVRRSENDKFLPGYFELPGGRVEHGEDLEHALNRKLQKEIKINPDGAMYFLSLAEVNRHGPYIRVVFEVPHKQQNTVNLSPAHDSYLWISRLDIKDQKITSDARAILTKYLGNGLVESNDVKKTTIKIYTDGGSRGNPGPSASAFVIYNDKDEVLETGGSYIGITTNNQAEYTALVLALKAVQQYADKNTTIVFYIDSLLVVNQMNGTYKIKNRELWPINQEIRNLIKEFRSVKFEHVSRENNVAADSKVNEILDAHK